MSDIVATILAGCLAIICGVFIGILFFRQRLEKLPVSTPSREQREGAVESLWKYYPSLPDDEPDTALFLLEQSQRSYDGWVESNARIEGKATWLTGFLAGGAGLLTLFGTAQGDKTHLAAGPFLWVAIGAAFGALTFCLYILRPKLRPHPSVSDYVVPSLAMYAKARFHIALSLAEDYNQSCLEIGRFRRYDPVAWTAAQTCISLAGLCVLIHFGQHLGDKNPSLC